MKLLIVTSIKEYQKKVADIFHQAQIKVFSVSETSGFKDDDGEALIDDWFSSGVESFDSIFIFSFTTVYFTFKCSFNQNAVTVFNSRFGYVS